MRQIMTILFFIACMTTRAQDSLGHYNIKAPIQVWQQLLDALDKSDASHLLITDLKKFIIEQINQQVKKPEVPKAKDTTKKEGKKE